MDCELHQSYMCLPAVGTVCSRECRREREHDVSCIKPAVPQVTAYHIELCLQMAPHPDATVAGKEWHS